MKRQRTDWIIKVRDEGQGLIKIGFIHNPEGFPLDVVRIYIRNYEGQGTEIRATLDEASLLATGILHVLSAVLSGVKPGLEGYVKHRRKLSDNWSGK